MNTIQDLDVDYISRSRWHTEKQTEQPTDKNTNTPNRNNPEQQSHQHDKSLRFTCEPFCLLSLPLLSVDGRIGVCKWPHLLCAHSHRSQVKCGHFSYDSLLLLFFYEPTLYLIWIGWTDKMTQIHTHRCNDRGHITCSSPCLNVFHEWINRIFEWNTAVLIVRVNSLFFCCSLSSSSFRISVATVRTCLPPFYEYWARLYMGRFDCSMKEKKCNSPISIISHVHMCAWCVCVLIFIDTFFNV